MLIGAHRKLCVTEPQFWENSLNSKNNSNGDLGLLYKTMSLDLAEIGNVVTLFKHCTYGKTLAKFKDQNVLAQSDFRVLFLSIRLKVSNKYLRFFSWRWQERWHLTGEVLPTRLLLRDYYFRCAGSFSITKSRPDVSRQISLGFCGSWAADEVRNSLELQLECFYHH